MIEVIVNRWPMVWAITSTVFALVMFFLTKTYAKRESVEQLTGRVDAIERQVANLPSEKDLHALQLDIAALRGDIRELGPKIARVEHITNLVTDYKFREKP